MRETEGGKKKEKLTGNKYLNDSALTVLCFIVLKKSHLSVLSGSFLGEIDHLKTDPGNF